MTLTTEHPKRKRRPDPRSKGVRTVRPHIRPNGRKLRTKENADKICNLLRAGYSLLGISEQIGFDRAGILQWVYEDGMNGGHEIAHNYARATDLKWDQLAEDLLTLVQRDCTGPDGKADPGLVQQLRVDVDTRKWLLSKMLPRKYGDRIEVSGDPSAPLVTRIELVAVEPPSRTRVIDNASDIDADDGSDDG